MTDINKNQFISVKKRNNLVSEIKNDQDVIEHKEKSVINICDYGEL